MAASTVTCTASGDPTTSSREITFFGTATIAPSAATYTTGGIVCSFAVAGLTHKVGPPKRAKFNGIAGWLYVFKPGTSVSNGLLMAFGQKPTDATAGVLPLAEFTDAAAIPASMSGDTITWEATWSK